LSATSDYISISYKNNLELNPVQKSAEFAPVRALLFTRHHDRICGRDRAEGTMRIDDVLQRIQGEFVEMPGLRLTAAQAQRLWGLERDLCDALLGALVDAKFLSQTRDGAFIRMDGARPTSLTHVKRGQTMAVA
jgi:hypothetical protein